MLRLKEIREGQGRTQAEVANALGISRSSYTNLENGKRDLGTETLLAFADYFQVSLDVLLGRDGESGGLDSHAPLACAQLVREAAERAARELLSLEGRGFRPVRTLVVGCSSSEIVGGRIGHMSSPETGAAVAEGVLAACRETGVDAAFQCCEHLNRALILERAVAERLGLEQVWVVPRPKAGGSLASAAWKLLKAPVAVEAICADAGLDIGETLIGMHLRAVAVPVRLTVREVGAARVTAARTRPRLIGGERARYTEED